MMKRITFLLALVHIAGLAGPLHAQLRSPNDFRGVERAAPSRLLPTEPLPAWRARVGFSSGAEASESRPDWRSAVAVTTTGAIFGGIVGGLYGGSQAQCTQCDIVGAFYGAMVGGLLGLGIGLIIART